MIKLTSYCRLIESTGRRIDHISTAEVGLETESTLISQRRRITVMTIRSKHNLSPLLPNLKTKN
jgi:hypothetical protein